MVGVEQDPWISNSHPSCRSHLHNFDCSCPRPATSDSPCLPAESFGPFDSMAEPPYDSQAAAVWDVKSNGAPGCHRQSASANRVAWALSVLHTQSMTKSINACYMKQDCLTVSPHHGSLLFPCPELASHNRTCILQPNADQHLTRVTLHIFSRGPPCIQIQPCSHP